MWPIKQVLMKTIKWIFLASPPLPLKTDFSKAFKSCLSTYQNTFSSIFKNGTLAYFSGSWFQYSVLPVLRQKHFFHRVWGRGKVKYGNCIWNLSSVRISRSQFALWVWMYSMKHFPTSLYTSSVSGYTSYDEHTVNCVCVLEGDESKLLWGQVCSKGGWLAESPLSPGLPPASWLPC